MSHDRYVEHLERIESDHPELSYEELGERAMEALADENADVADRMVDERKHGDTR